MGDPMQDVFDELAVPYQTIDDAPNGVVYLFAARYPAVEHGAVEDAGRYAAVFDATVDDWNVRDWLWRHTISGKDACYLPQTRTYTRTGESQRVAEEGVALDPENVSRNHLKYDMQRYMENVNTVERDWDVFETAYDETKNAVREFLGGEE